MLKKMLSSPLWSFAHHVFTWPFSVLICIHYVFGHFTISFNFSEAEIISGSSPLPACLLKWHGGRQHCLTTKYCQGTSGLVLRLSPSFGLYTAIEIFTEIPAPVVFFFSRKGKKNSFILTSSLIKGFLPLETVKYLDFYSSFFRFTGAQVEYLGIFI